MANLAQTDSVISKLLASPFFSELKFTHNRKSKNRPDVVMSFDAEVPEGESHDRWVSTEAIILYGCINCVGFEIEKAHAFHRVIAPEYNKNVQIQDSDLRTAFFFLVTCVTVIEEMTRDFSAGREIDYEIYEDKVEKYKPTFEGMLEDFQDELFGEYGNSVDGKQLDERLSQVGWKYFSLRNLNELFALKLQEFGTTNE